MQWALYLLTIGCICTHLSIIQTEKSISKLQLQTPAALSVIAKDWNQTSCPPVDEWVIKIVYIICIFQPLGKISSQHL